MDETWRKRLKREGYWLVATTTLQWIWSAYVWPVLLLAVPVMITAWTAYLAWWSSVDPVIKFPMVVFAAATALWLVNQATALRRPGRKVPAVAVASSQPEYPPFLVRFVERQQFYRGVSPDNDDYWVLKIEVVNARPVHVDKLEVFITGETNHLNTSKPLREKIPKQYLKNRRGVDHLNPGQSEEYVLVSIQNDPPFEWWGDHKLVAPGQLALIPTDSQHIVDVTVVSSTARSTQKLVLINTYNRQVLPVWPDPTTWIMNTKGPSH